MSDITHLIRLFDLDSENQQWRKDMADRVRIQIALLREEHENFKKRAESAEASAAALNAECNDLHSTNTRLEAERDEARRQLEQAVSAEREECAKVAESVRMIHGLYIGEIAYSRQTASDIASAIRARSNKTK